MTKKLDILFIHANSSDSSYQGLAQDFSAREIPLWTSLLANHVRNNNYSTAILDAECENLNVSETVQKIIEYNAKINCFISEGPNPNSSSQSMEGAVQTADELKKQAPNCKILFGGQHVCALPHEVLEKHKSVDFCLQNEGVYCLDSLLSVSNLNDDYYLDKVKGLAFRDEEGHIILNEINELVPQERLHLDLPGGAWDLLPSISKYRTSHWHSWSNDTETSPFASLYTNLGCKFQCFTETTRVITTNSINKKIKNVNIGDKVMAYDENTGKLVETTVVNKFVNIEYECLYRIHFENGRSITCTKEHPFYVKGCWIEAKDLLVGNEIHCVDFRDKISLNKKLYNPMFKEETQNKVREFYKNNPDKIVFTKEFFKKHPHGFPYSKNPEKKDINNKKMSDRMKKNNPMFDPEICKKVGLTYKKRIDDGEIVPFMCKPEWWEKISLKPNKMEQNFYNFLQENFQDEFKFVGDGTIRFNYYSPDFINENKKKIIEFNGCYWHKCSKCFPEKFKSIVNKRDVDRIKVYEKHGYRTLEIWQHDLKNEKALKKKIGDFLYNGIKIKRIQIIPIFENPKTDRNGRCLNSKPTKVYNIECFPYNNYFVGLSRYSGKYILSHNCNFCMINIINRTNKNKNISAADSNVFRFWEPEFIIGEFDKIAKLGVKNIKIADELFVYNPKHFMKVCDLLIERNYGFNIWCYSRIDSCKPQYLETLKKAGINLLALGIEQTDQILRKEIHKGGFKEVKITDLFDMIRKADINIIANYIVGLPFETQETMQYTQNFMMDNITDMMNIYPAQALPGSPLYFEMKKKEIKLPEKYAGYSMHSYYTENLSTDNLSASEILKFRDLTWEKYFKNPSYLQYMENKFGDKCVKSIVEMSKIKLKRKLLGD